MERFVRMFCGFLEPVTCCVQLWCSLRLGMACHEVDSLSQAHVTYTPYQWPECYYRILPWFNVNLNSNISSDRPQVDLRISPRNTQSMRHVFGAIELMQW